MLSPQLRPYSRDCLNLHNNIGLKADPLIQRLQFPSWCCSPQDPVCKFAEFFCRVQFLILLLLFNPVLRLTSDNTGTTGRTIMQIELPSFPSTSWMAGVSAVSSLRALSWTVATTTTTTTAAAPWQFYYKPLIHLILVNCIRHYSQCSS